MFVGDRQIKTIPRLGRVTTEDGCPILPEALARLCPPLIPGAASAPVAVCSLLCSVELKRWHLIAGKINTPPGHATDKKF